MKGKSLAVVLSVVAVLLIGTVIAAAVILKSDTGFDLKNNAAPVTETVRLEGLLPGESKTTQHSAKAEGAAIFTVAPERGSESELDPFLRVKVVVNGETAFDGTAEEFFVKGKAEIGVDGSFTFSVTYTLPESVGNEAQGKSSELKIIYSLKSVSLP